MKKKLFVGLIVGLFLAGCTTQSGWKAGVASNGSVDSGNSDPRRPKNIVLMIGDGMGLSQITAAMYIKKDRLNIERFPVIGLHKAYSVNDLVTDSGAGTTAFASGVKTYNGAIGVDQDTMPVKTILEEAKENGMATGMVTTSSITHATPAAFIAHVKSTDMKEDIAVSFANTEIDFFVGGGKKYFHRREVDNRNIYQELVDAGYFVSDYLQSSWQDLTIDRKVNFAYFTSDDDSMSALDDNDHLVSVCREAPRFLKEHNEGQGFFLMIQGSQIGSGGKTNNSENIISGMMHFDDAIGTILDFAQADGETLVIVTADHETGGFSINPGSTRDSIVAGFTSGDQTGVMIPVFAYGPSSNYFKGIYENTEIHNKMRLALKFIDAPN